MPFATESPTRSEPTSPGPRVTATPSTCSRVVAARSSAAFTTGSRFVRCWREASSGTTPPKGPCTASCDDTTDAASRPSRSTAAAESSQEVSTPRTITSLVGRTHREEDGVLAAPHEEENALALAAGLERLLVLPYVVHGTAVHLRDDVAAPQPGLGGRTVRLDLRHHDAAHAPVEPEVLRDLGGERLDREPQLL